MGVYRGETSKNAYSRVKEHLESYTVRNNDSRLWRHCLNYNEGEEKVFTMNVRKSLSRQISEAVYIKRTPSEQLINNRSEWNTAAIPTAIMRNNIRNNIMS